MSALTSNHYGTRAATHREYRLLFGLTLPLFVGGVLLRRLGLTPDRAPAGPLSSISFMATVGRRVRRPNRPAVASPLACEEK